MSVEEEEKEEVSPSDDVESAPPATNGHSEDNHRREHQLLAQKRPSMLPEVTPELIREHEAQTAAARNFSRGNSMASDDMAKESYLHFLCNCQSEDEHAEPAAICGIPYYLFMALAALAAAVTAGTVLAVVYYDPSDGVVLPPEYPPSPAPSIEMPFNSTTGAPTAFP